MKNTIFVLALIILNSFATIASENNDYESIAEKIEIDEVILTPSIDFMLQSDTSDTIAQHLEPIPLNLREQKYLKAHNLNIYELPYSWTGKCYDWKRLWINTATLTGAFVGTLVVLECLPEDATSWNRAEIRKDPPFKRWKQNVLEKGPCFDKDKWIFNYVLHPYAGAAYFMGARSCGFNFWQSLLYSAIISTIPWEFGIEACMEQPSIQDIFITPIVGSLIGEGFYKLKRKIVENGYRLAGSKALGNIVAFLVDPLNQFLGLFYGNPSRAAAKLYEKKIDLSSSFIVNTPSGPCPGISITCVF